VFSGKKVKHHEPGEEIVFTQKENDHA